jgi:hypothetical protein
MNIISILGNLFGIGKDYLKNKAKLKQAQADQRFEITKAETQATVNRINSETQGDLSIDLITARNKKYTLKDEILTYLFLMPVVIATIVPFIRAFSEGGKLIHMNIYLQDSYATLDGLPEWYKYVLFAVVVDVLGFRSFARKVVDLIISKWGKKIRPSL